MNNEVDENRTIVAILDSLKDDCFLLWEVYSEFNQVNKNSSQSISLKDFKKLILFLNKEELINSYLGINFLGEEELIKFNYNNELIKRMLDWETPIDPEIRITISKKGSEFMENLTKTY